MAPREQVVRDAHLAPLLRSAPPDNAPDASQQPSARDANAPAAPPEEPLSGAATPPSAAAPPRDVRDAGSPAARAACGGADAAHGDDASTQLGDLAEDLAQARTAAAIRQPQSLNLKPLLPPHVRRRFCLRSLRRARATPPPRRPRRRPSPRRVLIAAASVRCSARPAERFSLTRDVACMKALELESQQARSPAREMRCRSCARCPP
jgi:hypothetical protein